MPMTSKSSSAIDSLRGVVGHWRMPDTRHARSAAVSHPRLAVTAAVALLLTVFPILQPRVDAQLPAESDNRYAGLEWRFVRIRYHFRAEAEQDYGEPWYI